MRLYPRPVDCRNCNCDNESHDPLLGCLICPCPVRYPAAWAYDRACDYDRDAKRPLTAPQQLTPEAAQLVRDMFARMTDTDGKAHARRGRLHRFWRAARPYLRSLLGAVVLAALAAIMIVGAFLVALAYFRAQGS